MQTSNVLQPEKVLCFSTENKESVEALAQPIADVQRPEKKKQEEPAFVFGG